MIFQPVKFGMPKETLFFWFLNLRASLQVLVEPHIQIEVKIQDIWTEQRVSNSSYRLSIHHLWHPVEGSGIPQVKIFGYPKTSQNILAGCIWIGLLCLLLG